MPDLFRPGRDIVITGTQRGDGLFVNAGLDDHEVPVEVPGRQSYGLKAMAELGRAALIVTLGLSAYALVAGGAAAALGRRRLALSARNALFASFFSTLVASAVLVAGFLRDDFSLAYVAGHSSRDLPLQYKLSALWGGQEGSLLLWLLVLTAYAALAVWFARRRRA